MEKDAYMNANVRMVRVMSTVACATALIAKVDGTVEDATFVSLVVANFSNVCG